MDNDSEPNNKWSILNVARRQQSSSDLSKNMTKVLLAPVIVILTPKKEFLSNFGYGDLTFFLIFSFLIFFHKIK